MKVIFNENTRGFYDKESATYVKNKMLEILKKNKVVTLADIYNIAGIKIPYRRADMTNYNIRVIVLQSLMGWTYFTCVKVIKKGEDNFQLFISPEPSLLKSISI